MAKKKVEKTAGQNRSDHVAISLRLNPALSAALDQYIEDTRPRPTRTSVLEMLLEEFLQKQGRLPQVHIDH